MATLPSPQGDSYTGFQEPATAGSELNRIEFLFQQFMARTWTSMLVQVVDVNTAGSLTAPPLVDIQPMVHQIDGDGNATPHGTIYGVPCFRLQAGTSAVVADPVAGDIGVALFSHRDISGVVATGKPNVPGSRRRFDPSDAIYLGGVLGIGVAVTRYLQLASTGTSIVDPSQVTVTAPTVMVNASTKATVTAGECDLISSNVNLGGTGGKKVVLDGDPVIGGGGGTVQASSTKVRAV